MVALYRVHFHLKHVLASSLRGNRSQAKAYIVQLCRTLHQVALDGGCWTSASLLLPKPGLLYKQTCRGTEEELKIMAANTEALQKLKTVQIITRKDKGKNTGKGDKDMDK